METMVEWNAGGGNLNKEVKWRPVVHEVITDLKIC